jgi:hypothetical protein
VKKNTKVVRLRPAFLGRRRLEIRHAAVGNSGSRTSQGGNGFVFKREANFVTPPINLSAVSVRLYPEIWDGVGKNHIPQLTWAGLGGRFHG